MADTSRSGDRVGWSAWSAAAVIEASGESVIAHGGAGRDCAPGRLVEAARLTPSHDQTLVEATRSINQILDRAAAANADARRSLRIVVTQYGRVLVWARDDVDAPVGGLDAVEHALGLSGENFRPEPRRDWVVDDEGYLLYCRRGPNNQGAPEIRALATATTSHDAVLQQCTEQINTVLASSGGNSPDPRAMLALLSTPPGLFLAWTINDDETTQNPPGAITAASPVDDVNRALGLARPSAGGGPPWRFVIPALVGAALLAAIIIISCAAGAFSGEDDSDADATPSTTVRATAIRTTTGALATETPALATDLPAVTPTTAFEPTSPPRPTDEPVPTSPVEPTSNLDSTRPPAPTQTPNVPPAI